jgi:hypothetical protein
LYYRLSEYKITERSLFAGVKGGDRRRKRGEKMVKMTQIIIPKPWQHEPTGKSNTKRVGLETQGGF